MKKSKLQLPQKLRAIRIVLFDFDGIFTDGKVYVDETGRESVVCSRKDTLRMSEVKACGVVLRVISKEQNPVVARRCEKMKIECSQGVDPKDVAVREVLQSGYEAHEVAFMGDDINDLPAMKLVGVRISVSDGAPEVRRIADHVTTRRGGDHAVREFLDLLLAAKGGR